MTMRLQHMQNHGIFEFGHDTLTLAEYRQHRARNPETRPMAAPADVETKDLYRRNIPGVQVHHGIDAAFNTAAVIWGIDPELLKMRDARGLNHKHPNALKARRAVLAYLRADGYSLGKLAEYLAGEPSRSRGANIVKQVRNACPAMVERLAAELEQKAAA